MPRLLWVRSHLDNGLESWSKRAIIPKCSCRPALGLTVPHPGPYQTREFILTGLDLCPGTRRQGGISLWFPIVRDSCPILLQGSTCQHGLVAII